MDVSGNTIIQKQIIAETSNLAFYICIICYCYLKLSIKIGQKFSVQGHRKISNALRRMDVITYWSISSILSSKLLSVYLVCSKYNEKLNF